VDGSGGQGGDGCEGVQYGQTVRGVRGVGGGGGGGSGSDGARLSCPIDLVSPAEHERRRSGGGRAGVHHEQTVQRRTGSHGEVHGELHYGQAVRGIRPMNEQGGGEHVDEDKDEDDDEDEPPPRGSPLSPLPPPRVEQAGGYVRGYTTGKQSEG